MTPHSLHSHNPPSQQQVASDHTTPERPIFLAPVHRMARWGSRDFSWPLIRNSGSLHCFRSARRAETVNAEQPSDRPTLAGQNPQPTQDPDATPADGESPGQGQEDADNRAAALQDLHNTSAAGPSRWSRLGTGLLSVLASPSVLVLASFVTLRMLVVEARFIPSGSMLPALQLQDRLLVDKLSYRFRMPERGEIVVFHSPYRFAPIGHGVPDPFQGQCALVALPGLAQVFRHPKCDAYIKRVVALPGERVEVDPLGQVWINGEYLREPYVDHTCDGVCQPLSAQVPPDHVLVLGDNRPNSQDGRFWGFLPTDQVIGRAWLRFWPLETSGPLPPGYGTGTLSGLGQPTT